jgi:tetratricopeptide (TPR) repeat protein
VKYILFAVAPCLLLPVGLMAETTNVAAAQSVISTNAPASTNDAVQIEYERVMALDDAAAEEIDGWIVENNKFEAEGGGVPREELLRRIRERRAPVRKAYEEFVQRHPNHGDGRLAFASFLEDSGDMDGALEQMLKAKEVDPTNPAAWNNLANYYGHFGGVTNAFTHYEKAIELDPKEPVYYQNFGTTVFLFRKDAREHYGITEQQVFDKALMLYSNAMTLDPTNFLLATDIAMTYYGIKPPRHDDAMKAWNYALSLAESDLAREGVMIHLGRTELISTNFAKAREYLNAVTNAELAELKSRVLRSLESKENPKPEDELETEQGRDGSTTNPPAAKAP